MISLALVLVLLLQAKGQEITIKNLVFEGAGLRGIAYCGAIREMESRGIIKNIEKVGGTSAGALTALCICLGYSSEEIAELLHSTNFKKLNDGRFFFIGGINRVSKYFGWYRGRKMEDWIEKIIKKKTGDADITFDELYKKGYKDLYVTATVLNKQKLVVLSRQNYPAMQVKDAVRISMSIPLYFEAPFVNAKGELSRRPQNKEGLDIMVDGGLTGNFPIHIFDSAVTGQRSLYAPNPSTLGFRIDSDRQIESDRLSRELVSLPIHNLKEYTAAFYTIIIENLNRSSLSEDDWKRTVSIPDAEVKPRIRKMSQAEINDLIENGSHATKTFFNNK